ncbi:hypothetical protein V8E36_008650 [Tilletia maclaganii]
MVGGGGAQLYPPTTGAGVNGARASGMSRAQANDTAARLRGPPALYIPLLSVGMLGVQLVWSTEMAFASPYLLELGLSKASMAAVFVAGPLSGLLVQPIVGAMSDKCTHRWGRRRPYLAIAATLCSCSLLLLGYARSLSHTILLSKDKSNVDRLTILLAVLSIFGIDFSVNAVMSVDRALILDILPTSQQALGNAWAVRLTSIGLLTGFLIGNVDLPRTFPFSWLSFIWQSAYTDGAPPSEAQIKCLSVITASLLLLSHAMTAYAAVEQRLVPDTRSAGASGAPAERKLARLQSWAQNAIEPVRELRRTATNLPTSIWMVFRVQFFNWVAMYPLLFWGTVWIGSIYQQQDHPPSETEDEIAERGTRLGSLAMFYQSLLSLAISVVLPLLLPAASTSSTQRPRIPLIGLPLPIWNVSLPSLWALSHFSFALTMLFTWPAAWWSSTVIAVAVIAATGFSVATAHWIPFTLLGILVHEAEHSGSQRAAGEAEHLLSGEREGRVEPDEERDSQRQRRTRRGAGGEDGTDEEDDDLDALSFGADRDIETARNERISRAQRGAPAETHAGAVLGLHNVSIVAGQLAVTAISTLVFALMDSPAAIIAPPASSGQPAFNQTQPSVLPPQTKLRREAGRTHPIGPDAIGTVLRIGMVSAAIAGVLALRLRAKVASRS